MSELNKKFCIPCEGGILPLTHEQVNIMLKELPTWQMSGERGVEQIYRTFELENYYQTIAFVNAIAWVAHYEDHHPYLEIEYDSCTVRYWTHSINALSENDFICAARVNNLFSEMKRNDSCLIYGQ